MHLTGSPVASSFSGGVFVFGVSQIIQIVGAFASISSSPRARPGRSRLGIVVDAEVELVRDRRDPPIWSSVAGGWFVAAAAQES